jgi:MSHA biogenesis protein MshJ
MKAYWVYALERVDALSLRERIFLLASVVVCCIALVDVLLLSPAQTTQRQLVQRFETQGNELDRLRVELRQVAQPVDASKSVRESLADADQRLQSLNAQIRALLPTGQRGPALEQVLVQFLRRQDQLKLVTLSTALPASSPGAATAATSPSPDAPPSGLTRRTVVLTVAGPYPELVRYLKVLEASLPSLRWGSLQLNSDKPVPELTLQVHVLGVQP